MIHITFISFHPNQIACLHFGFVYFRATQNRQGNKNVVEQRKNKANVITEPN